MSSTRQLVIEMISDRLDPLDDWNLPEVVAEVTADIKADPELLNDYVDETLYTLVHGEAIQLLSRQRIKSLQQQQAMRLVTDPPKRSPSSASALRDRKRRGPRQGRGLHWLRHAEYIGTRHVRLMSMTAEQIDAAIAYRTKRRDGEDLGINFLLAIRQKVPAGSGVQIGDVYSAARLERIHQAISDGQPIPQEDDDEQQAV